MVSPVVTLKASERQVGSKVSYLSELFLTNLRTIEANLNSVSKTLHIQRQKMLKYVHWPILCIFKHI